MVNAFNFLQLTLHAVQHLVLHLLGRGPRPSHHGVHGGHVEAGVFKTAQPREGKRAHQQGANDQKQHKSAMGDRPFGHIE